MNMSKNFTFTYVVVYQNVTDSSDKVALVFKGTFSQVVEAAELNCFDGYFILEVKVA